MTTASTDGGAWGTHTLLLQVMLWELCHSPNKHQSKNSLMVANIEVPIPLLCWYARTIPKNTSSSNVMLNQCWIHVSFFPQDLVSASIINNYITVVPRELFKLETQKYELLASQKHPVVEPKGCWQNTTQKLGFAIKSPGKKSKTKSSKKHDGYSIVWYSLFCLSGKILASKHLKVTNRGNT